MKTYADTLEEALIVQLRVEMAERGMSQQDLAKALDITSATLSRYMKGHRSFPMPILFQTAEVLGIPAKTLVERAEARL